MLVGCVGELQRRLVVIELMAEEAVGRGANLRVTADERKAASQTCRGLAGGDGGGMC